MPKPIESPRPRRATSAALIAGALAMYGGEASGDGMPGETQGHTRDLRLGSC